jgi:predicted Zn finger-like uncharacterized protein
MLFTRCPECDTTFRLTDETLKKANGQVRCGRCASVFNAYAELHDPAAKSFEVEPSARGAVETPASGAPPASAPSANGPSAQPAADAHLDEAPSDVDSAAEPIGAASAGDVAADAERAAETAAAETPDEPPSRSSAISATDVERVLTADPQPLLQAAYAWDPARPPQRGANGRRWAVGAALALVTLSAQAVHHFRSDIAAHATFGPWLAATYDALGVKIAPTYDVRQYEILDWVATAEPNVRGLGSLKITARIQNRGPLRQPYPSVQLRLKDRWEEAVGSRMFTPAEYLPRDTPRGRLMSPGETARAEIEVVDPGPDAYGFELDVCIEVEASLVTCGTDEIFL